MRELSGNSRQAALARLLRAVAVWALFALAAHELVHRLLPVMEPVPGPGLAMLGAQALAVTLAVLLLLLLLRPARFIGPRAVFATGIWVALIVFGHYLSHLDAPDIRETLAALREGMGMGALLVSALMLAVLLGLPFVPSVEMGLLMMTVFGRDGAVAAWLATIAGLSMAYAAGRYMPVGWAHRWLERHNLLPEDRDPGTPLMTELHHRLHLSDWKGHRAAAFLMRHRYLLFAALINTPGNSMLGGGGGIALMSGFARLYRWPWFILTTALASLPIPLLVFFGLIPVEEWLAALGGG
jgi:hypothetical protein